MARQMKDSGVEWIGEIPSCWELRPARYAFSEVKEKNAEGTETRALQFKFGKIIAKTNFNAEDDDYVADTITNYTIVEPGTVMINGLNLNYDFKTQRVALVTERGVITSAYLALRPDEQLIDAEYATYLFKGYESKMALHNMGAGIRLTLGYREFKNQPVLFPTLCEQRRIVAFLDRRCAEIDAVIERTKATIEEYKKLKQAVITEAVTKGVRGKRKMKDSGIEWIGEIPEGWEVRKCKHISAFINGYAFDSADLVIDFRYPVIRIGDIKSGFVDFEHCQGVQWNQGLDNYKIQTNDILLAMSGATVGKVGLATPTNDSYINQRVGILRSNCYKYLFYALSTDCFIEYILLKASGSAQPNVSGIVCGNFPLPYPPDDEREEITVFLDEKCAALDTLITKKTALLTELEAYKKSLIYEYVTGKKEVPACP